jgi:uncharacterized repeat protein (TIGR02543 family)
VTAPVIAGYTVVAGSSPQTIVLAVDGNVVDFYYTADKNIEYTVNYYLVGTATSIRDSDVVGGQTMGASVVVTAPVIAGYTVVAGSSPQTIVLAVDGNVVDFYYTIVQYSIEYDLNGGSHSKKPDSYTIAELPLAIVDPIKTGFEFRYWVATYSSGSQVPLTAAGIPAGTTGDITLTAVWGVTPIDYTITYILNGGTAAAGNPTKYNVENSFAINSDTVLAPTLLGYKFSHWMVVYSNALPFTLTAAGIPAGTVGNVMLAAIWDPVPVPYSITYTLNGGDNAAGNPTKYNVKTSFPLAVHEPTKAGYTFSYWMVTRADGSQIQLPASGIPAVFTGDLKLAAVWNPQPVSYTITYDLGDNGEGVNPSSNVKHYDVTFGQITIANPTRSNYTFKHWLVTYANSTEQTILTGSVIPAGTTGNLKLVAVWE